MLILARLAKSPPMSAWSILSFGPASGAVE